MQKICLFWYLLLIDKKKTTKKNITDIFDMFFQERIVNKSFKFIIKKKDKKQEKPYIGTFYNKYNFNLNTYV